jgi:hypothetical protein
MQVTSYFMIGKGFSTTVYFHFTDYFPKDTGFPFAALFPQKKTMAGYARLPNENSKIPTRFFNALNNKT